jgi:hypothetical protein
MIESIARARTKRDLLEWLWETFPAEREHLRPYVERAKAHKNECGCTMGGMFLIVAVVVFALDTLLVGIIGGGSSLRTALYGSAFVLGSSLVGKAVGMGVARLRLLLLYRKLRIQYAVLGG